MMILNTTMDLVDAILNRELQPWSYSGRFMYGKSCGPPACKSTSTPCKTRPGSL